MMQSKSRNSKVRVLALDVAHVVICAVIILLAIMVFIKPYSYNFCYPIIFFLAALLNLSGSLVRFQRRSGHKNVISGIFMALVALILFMLAIVSLVSIWRA